MMYYIPSNNSLEILIFSMYIFRPWSYSRAWSWGIEIYSRLTVFKGLVIRGNTVLHSEVIQFLKLLRRFLQGSLEIPQFVDQSGILEASFNFGRPFGDRFGVKNAVTGSEGNLRLDRFFESASLELFIVALVEPPKGILQIRVDFGQFLLAVGRQRNSRFQWILRKSHPMPQSGNITTT